MKGIIFGIGIFLGAFGAVNFGWEGFVKMAAIIIFFDIFFSILLNAGEVEEGEE